MNGHHNQESPSAAYDVNNMNSDGDDRVAEAEESLSPPLNNQEAEEDEDFVPDPNM